MMASGFLEKSVSCWPDPLWLWWMTKIIIIIIIIIINIIIRVSDL